MALAQCCTHPPVTVATMIALEDVGDRNTSVRVFVCSFKLGAVIEVGATGQVKFSKKFHKRIGVLQGVNQQCFLLVAQEPRGDAQAFF